MRYDIFNPTTHDRVIYDGIKNAKGIRIERGQWKRGVELADHIAQGFNVSPCDDTTDLVLTCLDEQSWRQEEVKPLPADYKPYVAPPIFDGDTKELGGEFKEIPELAPKRKRGRPRKNPAPISIGE